jgi:hypothetical protein
MGTRQTLDVLQSYASLLSDLGSVEGSCSVRSLAHALSAASDKPIKATVAKVSKHWTAMAQAPPLPASLAQHLTALRLLLSAAGAKAVSADLQQLAKLIEGSDGVEPGAFERALLEAIVAPKPSSRKAPSRQPLSPSDVRLWADKLTTASADQQLFEKELTALQAIPKLGLEELRAVAEQFLGHTTSGKKAVLVKALRTRQKQDALEASRQARISRIAV